jgi:hypothetical protein
MKKTILLMLILIIGQACGSLAVENTWTRKADMPTARCTFSTGVVNERIYAVGGAKGRTDPLRSVPLQTVEEYQPATDTWTRKADMPTPRYGLPIPGCGITTCLNRATGTTGLSPVGLQPCRPLQFSVTT